MSCQFILLHSQTLIQCSDLVFQFVVDSLFSVDLTRHIISHLLQLVDAGHHFISVISRRTHCAWPVSGGPGEWLLGDVVLHCRK